ncbi:MULTISPECIES: type I polyketide synthase [unclassified Chitinophaga]|uniref:type I polyketide synthase n=1 Tax=unclassified Chitinophaga TaxID=2619133 RepID=UPI00301007FD
MNKKDIAIVGMSCKFVDTENIQEFWEHLRAGKELLDFDVPADTDTDTPGYVGVRAAVKDKGSFDYSFFGYTRDEAAIMDPQIRLFHEYTWKALEDAGIDPYLNAGKIGLFAGAGDNSNWLAHNFITGLNSNVDSFSRNQLVNRNFLSTLVAYKLNLKGPAYFIDTACSTSLAAVHIACRNLLMKECDVAVAGGIQIKTVDGTGYVYKEGMINSIDGHCKTFDADSSGTVGGEGLGIVVLKRLEEAVAANDHIYAVIRSSAVNNDGNRKVGYTAPSASGQAECIIMAHKLAGIHPSSVSYVEAHGTATKLGDPIEVEALNKAFGNNPEKHCAIGSVKSNMGHLDTAAGIAGLIKTVLCLYHKEIPASLHFRTPNPEIDFDHGPFHVNTHLKKWESLQGTPLRAGVSSFGIGGTNVHVVLEEAPQLPAPATGSAPQLLLCTAKSKLSLDTFVGSLETFMKEQPVSLEDISFSLQRRHQFKHRYFTVGKDNGDAIASLKQGRYAEVNGKPPAVVFMFSGQGAQYLNMGKGLYDQEPFFKQQMDKGFGLLQQLTGRDYKALLFNDGDINNTLHAQPLLFVFEYALASLLIEWGIRPQYMIGHSIGELTTACISGVFSFEDGMKLVLERAALMAGLPGGSMLSIGRDAADVLPLLVKGTTIAAVNAPDYCVVSGTEEDINLLREILTARRIPFTPLKTSHAFHSAMMDPIIGKLSEKAALITFSKPLIPFVSNVSGKIAGDEVLQPGYWDGQMRQPVLFRDGINALASFGKMIFIEIGPGNTLTTFCRKIHEKTNGNTAVNLIRHPLEVVDDLQLLLERIGELWLQGVAVNLNSFYHTGRRNIPLPAYCFDKTDLPAVVHPITAVNDLLRKQGLTDNPVNPLYYLHGWKRSSLMERPVQTGNTCLLFDNGGAVAEALKTLLLQKGHDVVTILQGDEFKISADGVITVNPLKKEDYVQLLEYLIVNEAVSGQLIYTWSLSAAALHQHFICLLQLCKMLKADDTLPLKRLLLITQQLHPVFGPAAGSHISVAPALGLLKVFVQETPGFFYCNVDIPQEEAPAAIAAGIYDELQYNAKQQVVALRNGERWAEDFEQVEPAPAAVPILREGGIYVITGGLGKAGVCLAAYLLKQYNAKVALIGRTSLQKQTNTDVFKTLQQLPGQVAYYCADVADYNALSGAINEITAGWGAIHGVIHAAGNIGHFAAVEQLDEQDVNAHFRAKVNGLQHLYEIFRDQQPDFVWLMSSLSVVLGGLTFGAYAAANTFMQHFTDSHRRELRNWITVNLDGLSFPHDKQPAGAGITPAALITVFEQSLSLRNKGSMTVTATDLYARLTRAANNNKGNASVKVVTPGSPAPVLADNNFSGIEQQLMLIWCEFFGLDNIGPEDNFFELGGDSIKAMTLLKRIHKILNIELLIETIFRNPTITALSKEIEISMEIRQLKSQTDTKDIKELII